jgi:hypothetical protein
VRYRLGAKEQSHGSVGQNKVRAVSGKGVRYILKLMAVPIAMIVSGGLIGLLISATAPHRSTVTVTLPFDGDVQLYRSSEPHLKSVRRLQSWAVAKGLSTGPELDALMRLPLATSHVFYISKSDLRDLPDALTNDLIPRSSARPKTTQPRQDITAHPNPSIRSALLITLTGKAATSKVATLAAEFVRDTLTFTDLLETLQDMAVEARVERAQLKEEILTKRMNIDSFKRLLASVGRLREKYSKAWTEETSALAVSTLQNLVQSKEGQASGWRYLSPLQQLVSLEALLAEQMEQAVRLQERVVYFDVLDQFIAAFRRDTGLGTTAENALDNLLRRANEIRSAPLATQYPHVIEAAADNLTYKLITIRSRFIDSVLKPGEPLLRGPGTGREVVPVLVGCTIAALLWLLLISFGILRQPPVTSWPAIRRFTS